MGYLRDILCVYKVNTTYASPLAMAMNMPYDISGAGSLASSPLSHPPSWRSSVSLRKLQGFLAGVTRKLLLQNILQFPGIALAQES